MAQKIAPYARGPMPQFPGSEREYFDRELQKLEKTLREVIEAIAALQAKAGL